MAKYNTAPIDPLKIQLIQDMLSSPLVNALWLEFVNLGNVPNVKFELREKAFNDYAAARDAYLGLPPLKIVPMHSEHSKRKTWQ